MRSGAGEGKYCGRRTKKLRLTVAVVEYYFRSCCRILFSAVAAVATGAARLHSCPADESRTAFTVAHHHWTWIT